MKNNLKNDLEMLLVGLQDLNLLESRASMVETLELLAEEVNSAVLAIKAQAHIFLDDGNMEGVQKCMKLSNSIGNLSNTIVALQDVETYEDIQEDNETSAPPQITTNKNSKPIAFNLKNNKYHLMRYTWRQLFYQVLCVLAELDANRFSELVKVLNDRKLTYYSFSENSDSLLSDTYKNKPWHIPSVNLYVKLTGDASVMRRSTYEVVSFFNLASSFTIETNTSDANNIINIVDDDEE